METYQTFYTYRLFKNRACYINGIDVPKYVRSLSERLVCSEMFLCYCFAQRDEQIRHKQEIDKYVSDVKCINLLTGQMDSALDWIGEFPVGYKYYYLSSLIVWNEKYIFY